MSLEAVIQGILIEEAEAAGWLHRKLKWLGRRNAPDDFFARDGRIVLIEFKQPHKDARETQAKEIRTLREHGVEVHVVANAHDFRRIMLP